MTSLAQNQQTIEHSETILGVSDGHILADVELGRVAVAVGLSNLFRVWLVAREASTRRGGCGWLPIADLPICFEAFTGCAIGDRHLRRLLARGDNQFWTRRGNRIYLAGIARLAEELCILAGLRGLKHVIATNRPGGLKSAWLDMSGSHEQFEANLYAAWLGSKADTTIARQTLSGLWNRDASTLRRWEQTRLAGRVIVTPGYAITGDVDRLPSDGATWNNRARSYVWQLPNTYRSTVRQTPRNGQRKRVQQAVNGPSLGAGADTHRLYYNTAKGLNRAIKHHPAQQHIRYVFVGRWRGNIFFSPGADSNAAL